jgi:hypothetical protein
MRRGDPASKRRLETRFLIMSETGAYGVTYKWDHITDGQSQTEATLVGADGEDLELVVDHDNNPGTADVAQTWHFPTRTECMNCHNTAGGTALSFNTRQLNREGTIDGAHGDFLSLLHGAGYLDRDPGNPAFLPKLVRPTQIEYSLEARVRSWLDVNCAYCHSGVGGAAPPSWDGRLHQALSKTGLINGVPTSGPLNPGELFIVPGNSELSIVKHRIARTGGYAAMPPLGSNLVDTEAVRLITEYINHEATDLMSYVQWRLHHFGDLASPEGEPDRDPDQDGKTNGWERLTNTNPNQRSDAWMPELTVENGEVRISFSGLSNRSVLIWRSENLLDWFRWDAAWNDGIPLDPGMTHEFIESRIAPEAFFRFEVREN